MQLLNCHSAHFNNKNLLSFAEKDRKITFQVRDTRPVSFVQAKNCVLTSDTARKKASTVHEEPIDVFSMFLQWMALYCMSQVIVVIYTIFSFSRSSLSYFAPPVLRYLYLGHALHLLYKYSYY